jgi:hypothetical protein
MQNQRLLKILNSIFNSKGFKLPHLRKDNPQEYHLQIYNATTIIYILKLEQSPLTQVNH